MICKSKLLEGSGGSECETTNDDEMITNNGSSNGKHFHIIQVIFRLFVIYIYIYI